MAENDVMKDAQTLQDALVKTDEFKELQATYDELKKDQDAFKTFKDFQTNQNELRQKQMAGQQISQDDMKKAQELANKMNSLDIIKKLMGKEKAMGKVIDDANMLITKPLRDMYEA
ncbi:YlbF family regulator [Fructilactobacillus fructivorans]|uniref:Uncharacterized protein n=1 Tax=Fructilactobacillus fructivorans TaxID=1614 RepID=A0A0C1Q2P4_9LACO|nr:YlbF family regulator [Fructilactobacillus fructivorans]KID42083.1 hypothetical protein LfDm3_0488 [Fructilactobacillus fructivorans]KRK58524.1 hypothetical protein FC73_GL000079 [Fructilactobacillus fructivorans]KRN13369.1 hypothetical protein IV37_GL000085 [Fructilactobacillus fructivorans]KRN40078.1 hypothetical protein IV51_GL000259 [Fructilactobacillus fructivorans]KRN42505.1 hypothetical protein IV48_GL000153 [Fructilactobacillus fructivorans]